MTNFLTLNRDHILISEIIAITTSDQHLCLRLRHGAELYYDFATPDDLENDYLKIKQQLEAWHLNQNKIHSSMPYKQL